MQSSLWRSLAALCVLALALGCAGEATLQPMSSAPAGGVATGGGEASGGGNAGGEASGGGVATGGGEGGGSAGGSSGGGSAGGSAGGGSTGGGSAGGGSAGGSSGGGSAGGGTAGGGSAGGAAGGGPCTRGGALNTSLKVTTVGPGSASVVHYAQTATGGALAWHSSDGVHVTPLNADDTRAGADLVVPGSEVLGFAAGPHEFGLLVPRPPDQLVVVRIGETGATLPEKVIIAGGNHATIGVEWFGEFAQTGRLVRIAGGYAAYSALHRRWPDNIGHQGDQLRRVMDNGSVSVDWDWGCSHSGDQRLLDGPTGLAPVCVSDCYPVKAIMFNHNGGIISDEPAGNCAGVYGGELGNLASAGGALWFDYASREGRTSNDVALVKLGSNGQVLQRQWIAQAAGDESHPHLATFDGALLAGWTVGGQQLVQRVGLDGLAVGSPETMTAPAPFSTESDWVSLLNGDVAWAFSSGGQLQVARVRACVP